MFNDALRRRARHLCWLVTLPLVILILALLGAVVQIAMDELSAGRELLWNVPMILYVAAIWLIRSALARIASGEMFGRVVPSMLLKVGYLLCAGGLFQEFGRGLVSFIAYGELMLHTFDASGITLAVVGAALALFAHLLRTAADMREELEEFL